MARYIRRLDDSKSSRYLTLGLGALVIAILRFCASTQSFNVPDDVAPRIRLDDTLTSVNSEVGDPFSPTVIVKLNNTVHKVFERFPPQAKSQ